MVGNHQQAEPQSNNGGVLRLVSRRLHRSVRQSLALSNTRVFCNTLSRYAWDATRDKSATLYIFESWPGFAVLCLNAFLLLNFWVLTFRSFVFEKRKPKKIFYRNFVILYTAWYLQIPIAVIIASLAKNYTRDKLVVSFLCICRFLVRCL